MTNLSSRVPRSPIPLTVADLERIRKNLGQHNQKIDRAIRLGLLFDCFLEGFPSRGTVGAQRIPVRRLLRFAVERFRLGKRLGKDTDKIGKSEGPTGKFGIAFFRSGPKTLPRFRFGQTQTIPRKLFHGET